MRRWRRDGSVLARAGGLVTRRRNGVQVVGPGRDGRAGNAPPTCAWYINVRPKHGRSTASSMLRSRCSPAAVVIVPPRLFNGFVFAFVRSLLNGYELGGAP